MRASSFNLRCPSPVIYPTVNRMIPKLSFDILPWYPVSLLLFASGSIAIILIASHSGRDPDRKLHYIHLLGHELFFPLPFPPSIYEMHLHSRRFPQTMFFDFIIR